MLPSRSMIQTSRTLNHPTDDKIFTTYQDEYNSDKQHGNPVKHYGNTAFLNRAHTASVSMSDLRAKPFLAQSYNNLNSDSYIANRFSDNYSNNYKTSEDNTLRRSMPSRPVRTKLDHLFKVKIAPVSKVDEASAYEHEYLHGRKNDHFHSKKLLKTDTQNLNDTLACLIELADHMRNKSYDINARKLFATDAKGANHLDTFGKYFTRLISLMEEIINSYGKLKCTAVELKKMADNFIHAEHIIDRNIWDRKLKPAYERTDYKNIEDAIFYDKKVFNEQKEVANKTTKEAEVLLNLIESFILKDLNSLFEESRIILMSKFHNKDYEIKYLRDSNGYIKNDPKLPMKIENWFNLAENSCQLLSTYTAKANQRNVTINDLIKKISLTISNQWIDTHKTGIKQVEQSLTTQGKLITHQYDMKGELNALDRAIYDTRNKMDHCQKLDESLLTQITTPVHKIDPLYAENRKFQMSYANSVWSHGNDLRDNLKNMEKYHAGLRNRIQRLDTNIKSNHHGINYDIKTIVNPRGHAVGTQPSIGLVRQSIAAFE